MNFSMVTASSLLRRTAVAAVLPLLMLLASCETSLFETYQDPVFCISLHQVVKARNYGPDSRLFRPVSSLDGSKETLISKFPLVDSSCFGDVQLVRGDNGRWGLRLTMDNRGRHLWREATVEHRCDNLAIILDGFLVHTMPFPKIDESGILMIPPVWREAEARQIAEHVVSNYKILNKNYL